MFWLFVHTLPAGHKFSLLNKEKLTQPIQMQLSEKQKTFSQFLINFGNVYQILNIFEKKVTLIADVFWKLRNPKNIAR